MAVEKKNFFWVNSRNCHIVKNSYENILLIWASFLTPNIFTLCQFPPKIFYMTIFAINGNAKNVLKAWSFLEKIWLCNSWFYWTKQNFNVLMSSSAYWNLGHICLCSYGCSVIVCSYLLYVRNACTVVHRFLSFLPNFLFQLILYT